MSSRRRRPSGRQLAAVLTSGLLASTAFVVSAGPAAAESEVVRIAGDDRYETAAEIASGFETGLDRVYIAAGTDYPDALAGAPAATIDEAPVLLVGRGNVPAVTAAELDRLDPAQIVLLGGTSAISGGVATQLATYADDVERRDGANRYATSVAVSQATFEPGVSTVYIASGQDYPDALAVGPVAGAEQAPVLLTQRGNIPQIVRDELTRLDADRIIVLGGTSAISTGVTAALQTYTDGSVTRWQGQNRYETSVEISERNFTSGADVVFLATGQDYPDALAGGPVAALSDAPILLTQRNNLPAVVVDELIRLDPEVVIILGGPRVITQAVADKAEDPTATGPSAAAAAALAALDDIRVATSEAGGYNRDAFGSWTTVNGCDTRNRILIRDLTRTVVDDNCLVQSGTLRDPYTNTTINFVRGVGTSNDVQIDHVVSLSAAWKMGANTWTAAERRAFNNDADNLLAVDGPANGSKGDRTLGEWQPPNTGFHCEFTIMYIETTDDWDLALKQIDVDYAEDLLPSC